MPPRGSEPCDRYYHDTFTRDHYKASIRDNQGYIDIVPLAQRNVIRKGIAEKLGLDLRKIPKI